MKNKLFYTLLVLFVVVLALGVSGFQVVSGASHTGPVLFVGWFDSALNLSVALPG